MVAPTTYEAVHTLEPIYTGGSVALSEDGCIFASCLGEDVLLTELATGRRLAKIEGDGAIITTISLTPSASYLITCSRSLSMRIYTLGATPNDGVAVELTRTLKPHVSPVVTSTVDKSGTLIATGASDGTVKIWDIRGGYTTHSLHGHSGVISALRFFKIKGAKSSFINEYISSASRTKRPEIEMSLVGTDRTAVEGSLADFRLASGDEDGKIRIWNLQNRKCVAVLDSHVSVIRSIDFDEVKQVLLSASRDKAVVFWSALTWKSGNTMPILEEVEAAGFVSQQPGLLYTGGSNGRLRLWWTTGHEATEEQIQLNEGQSIVDVLYYPGLPFIMSVHADQNLLIHSLASLKDPTNGKYPPLSVDRRISGNHDEIIDLAYVGQQRNFLAVATNLEDLKILTLRPPSVEDSTFCGADVGLLQGHQDIIICVDVDWSGNWLATGAKDNTARIWRIDPENSSYSCHAVLTGHAESLGAVALPKQRPSADSNACKSPLDYPPPFILTGSQDRTIKRWDTGGISMAGINKPPRALYTRKAHDKDINAIDINHDSSLFLSASQDRTVKIWSLELGEPVGVLRGHKRGVWSAKFSPQSTTSILGGGGVHISGSRGYVLTGSGDKTVKIWSVNDFSCLRTLEGHTNSVLKVLWMNSVVPALPQSQDGTGNEYDELPSEDKRHNVIATLDNQVVSAGGDGLVKIWDVSSSECNCTLDNHTDRVWALVLNPNPTRSTTTLQPTFEAHTLISGGADATLTLWMNTTVETTHLASIASNQRMEQDQALQNYIRSRSYRPAIRLALKLNHPARLLSLFTEVAKTWPKEEGSLTGLREVDAILGDLTEGELLNLLGRCREWNSNARTSPIAQSILWALLKSHPASRFGDLRSSGYQGPPRQAAGGLRHGDSPKEILDALHVYTERHFKRMEELIEESFLVDYTLREMDEVLGTLYKPHSGESAPVTNGAKTNGDNLFPDGAKEDLMVVD